VQLHVLHPLEGGPGAVEGNRRGSCAWTRARPPPGGPAPACGRSTWPPWRTGTPPRYSRCHAGTRRPRSRARRVGRGASRGRTSFGCVEASAGRLARQGVGLPVHHRAEQGGRLVVQVVAGGHHRVAVLERGGPIHQVALGEPARRAGGPTRGLLHDRDRGRPPPRPPARRAGSGPGPPRTPRTWRATPWSSRRCRDPGRGRRSGRPSSIRTSQSAERVLAARDRDHDRLVGGEHVVPVDGLRHLLAEGTR